MTTTPIKEQVEAGLKLLADMAAEITRLKAEVERMLVPLDRAFTKLRAYRGVCKDDKELDVVINLVRNALAPEPEKEI